MADELKQVPESLTTDRLVLRRPRPADAAAIFSGYAADPLVTRLLGWPRHRSIDDSRAFIAWCDDVWASRGAGPYLIVNGDDVIGSTGLDLETEWRAQTGYVLARAAWRRGYATEATTAMVELADAIRVIRLYALCHPDNPASARVLVKAGFNLEGVLRRYCPFPNSGADGPLDVQCWARVR
jgi:RimJ/RimL family protein N-acetyltransferase